MQSIPHQSAAHAIRDQWGSHELTKVTTTTDFDHSSDISWYQTGESLEMLEIIRPGSSAPTMFNSGSLEGCGDLTHLISKSSEPRSDGMDAMVDWRAEICCMD